MSTVNRILTLLVSITLVGFGLVLAVEVVGALFGSHPLLVDWRGAYRTGRSDRWDSASVRVLASAVTAIGLLLLLAQLKPRRISRLAVSSDDPNTDAALTRAGVRSALRRAAENVDGIRTAKVKIARRSAKVVARARASQPGLAQGLDAEVQVAVAERLTALQLRHPPRVRTSVQTRKAQS